jgi:sporulation protein YlmC with PRC-barrel domain
MAPDNELDLGFHVLDRQVVDRDGRLVCKVDDLELDLDEQGSPYVTSILVGTRALGPRLHGRLGRWITAIGERLATEPGPLRIDWSHVSDVGSHVEVLRTVAQLDVDPLEDWADDRVVSRIPGSRHESE